jgi:hypothetical protein
MAPHHKGKSKAIEVPSHILFSQVEMLCEAFPGEEQAIQEVLMSDTLPTPCPSSTTGQKHSHSNASLTPEAKCVLSPPTPSQESGIMPVPPPTSAPLPDVMVEDMHAPTLPEIFSGMSIEEFQKWFIDLNKFIQAM